MIKPGLYLDTTVPSAYLDARTPDRQHLTREFWHTRLPLFRVRISGITMQEIRNTPEMNLRLSMETLVAGFQILPMTDEAIKLSTVYIKRGVIPEKYKADAQQVAIAVVHGIGYFTSWNYKHLVKIAARREINLINALAGYGPIEIATPPEI